jgi:hypothetical protein
MGDIKLPWVYITSGLGHLRAGSQAIPAKRNEPGRAAKPGQPIGGCPYTNLAEGLPYTAVRPCYGSVPYTKNAACLY